MLEFKKKTVTSTFMDPREGFARKSIDTEIRFDPLTGESGRLAHFGAIKTQKVDFSSEPGCRKYCPSVRKILKQQHPGFPETCRRFSAERRSKGYTEHLSL